MVCMGKRILVYFLRVLVLKICPCANKRVSLVESFAQFHGQTLTLTHMYCRISLSGSKVSQGMVGFECKGSRLPAAVSSCEESAQDVRR